MKRIELKLEKPIDSVTLFREIIGRAAPDRPFSLDEMRKRVRILNAFDRLIPDAPYLDLEDADYDVLMSAVVTTPYNIATAQVLAIVDAVIDAKAPPMPDPPVVTDNPA